MKTHVLYIFFAPGHSTQQYLKLRKTSMSWENLHCMLLSIIVKILQNNWVKIFELLEKSPAMSVTSAPSESWDGWPDDACMCLWTGTLLVQAMPTYHQTDP